jgi:histidine triad (HIT) family protein
MQIRLDAYDACSFCRYIAREESCAFVAEDDLALAFINRAQFERGAMLVIPRQHRETILDMHDQELAAAIHLAKRLVRAVVACFGAVGANVFQNNGAKSGQQIPHYHVHIVPRYEASDPTRLFHSHEFPITPLAEQLEIAAAIRAAL